MPEKYLYYATNGNETRQVYPKGTPKINDTKDLNDFRRGYKRKISGDLTFLNDRKNAIDDFTWFYNIEVSTGRCNFIYLSISKWCDTGYIEDWAKGRISLNDGTWDLDGCKVKFAVDSNDKYACIDDVMDVEFNFFALALTPVTAKIGVDIYDNGRALKEVFQGFFRNTECNNPIKSDFFQWNPDNVSPINYVTLTTTEINNLVLFQKSDVKRPFDANNATFQTVKLSDLLKDVCTMFNCLWDVDEDGSFRIEHLSYWQAVPGLDLTIDRYARYVRMENKYSYNRGDMPKTEKFTFKEGRNRDIIGVPITYGDENKVSSCVASETGSQTKEYNVDIITTDIDLIIKHPLADNADGFDNVITDLDFALMALDSTDTIISKTGILSNPVINNVLGWAWLHRNYYTYGRVLSQGYMNNVLTSFNSTVKTKKQVTLNIPLCCGDVFDPSNSITTGLGSDGEVVSASYNMASDMLTLDIVFGLNSLEMQRAAGLVDDYVITPINTGITIPVLDNDTPGDFPIDPATVVILGGPLHGTAVVHPDGTVTYTPDTDYTGPDAFSYGVSDTQGNDGGITNYAIVHITVTPMIEGTCSGAAGHITSITGHTDGTVDLLGLTVYPYSLYVVYGSPLFYGVYSPISRPYTYAEIIAADGKILGIPGGTNNYFKLYSFENDGCIYGYSNTMNIGFVSTGDDGGVIVIVCQPIITWQGEDPYCELVDGVNTGMVLYHTRRRLIDGIEGNYTEPNDELGCGDYVPGYEDTTMCPIGDVSPGIVIDSDASGTIDSDGSTILFE